MCRAFGSPADELADNVGRIGGVAAAGCDQRRAADPAQLGGRIVGVVGVGVDLEDAQVRIATADVRSDQPEGGARQAWKPRQGPRAEERPALPPLAREEVIDGPTLAHLDVVGHAMGREPEDEALDELRVPDGQPLGVVATGRDAHHADRAPPLLADDRGVVVGDIRRRCCLAAGRRAGRPGRTSGHAGQ